MVGLQARAVKIVTFARKAGVFRECHAQAFEGAKEGCSDLSHVHKLLIWLGILTQHAFLRENHQALRGHEAFHLPQVKYRLLSFGVLTSRCERCLHEHGAQDPACCSLMSWTAWLQPGAQAQTREESWTEWSHSSWQRSTACSPAAPRTCSSSARPTGPSRFLKITIHRGRRRSHTA